ncbi:unnamed protein product [Protopolystoma xenopodis]|uniref:Uncharacterized protein n=1 Tax=Protopolystoma xenopodis TaxID=117903 RepID=A0A3S5FBS6_9PLAT|nr:unnamed protein product [Protopolystoma xenopodis]
MLLCPHPLPPPLRPYCNLPLPPPYLSTSSLLKPSRRFDDSFVELRLHQSCRSCHESAPRRRKDQDSGLCGCLPDLSQSSTCLAIGVFRTSWRSRQPSDFNSDAWPTLNLSSSRHSRHHPDAAMRIVQLPSSSVDLFIT